MCPTYQPNIPQPTNKLSISQNDLLENFQQLNTAFSVDHLSYNAGDQGHHNVVNLVVGAIPAPIPNFLTLFSQGYKLYVNSGASPLEQISGTTQTLGNPGCITFPNGIKIIWGNGQSTTNAMTAKDYDCGGFPNAAWNIIMSCSNNYGGDVIFASRLDALVSAGGTNKTQYLVGCVVFPVGSGDAGLFYNYIAIGN